MNKGQRAGDGALAIQVEQGKSYYWCSCGKSSKQPFCDGSHKGTEFKPLAYKAELTKRVFFCVCKQTIDQPFCCLLYTSPSPRDLVISRMPSSA